MQKYFDLEHCVDYIVFKEGGGGYICLTKSRKKAFLLVAAQGHEL